MKRLLLAVSAAALMSGVANAADAVYEEVPVAVEVAGFSWTGFYVGIHGGYSIADGSFSSPDLAPGVAFEADSDLDGFLVGAHVGAQYQFQNNLVLGVEMDIDYRDSDDNAGVTFNGFPAPPLAIESEINWTGSARLRAGYAMDRFMPYITGGFAFADVDVEVTAGGAPLPPVGTDLGGTSVGWTLGGGVEYAFTDNMIFRAEYRYSDFGDVDGLVFFAPIGDSEFELDSHDITIGISYKF
jgi:outer membrane immunogenic protein